MFFCTARVFAFFFFAEFTAVPPTLRCHQFPCQVFFFKTDIEVVTASHLQEKPNVPAKDNISYLRFKFTKTTVRIHFISAGSTFSFSSNEPLWPLFLTTWWELHSWVCLGRNLYICTKTTESLPYNAIRAEPVSAIAFNLLLSRRR